MEAWVHHESYMSIFWLHKTSSFLQVGFFNFCLS